MKRKCIYLILIFMWVIFMNKSLVCAAQNDISSINDKTIDLVINNLIDKHGKEFSFRINRGVKQTADLWRIQDGDEDVFVKFCLEYFISDPKKLDETFSRFEQNLESINGHFNAVCRQMKWSIDVECGEILPVDYLFAEFSPFSHMDEDLFNTKAAFVALLNFPVYTLREKLENGHKWTRLEWAMARLPESFISRVPSDVLSKVNKAYLDAEDYINKYNIYMHNLVDAKGNRLFPEGLKLITHWGLRDELKSLYSEKDSLNKQKAIYAVMNRIICQDIPQNVIDNSELLWNPVTNKVFNSKGLIENPELESNKRYKMFLDIFRAEQLLDPYFPKFPSCIDRRFNLEREIPEKEVEGLLTSVLSSDVVKDVAKLIEKRLGRRLEPFDIWYTGFSVNKNFKQADLDSRVSALYPNVEAFQAGLPDILKKLGFTEEKAEFLAKMIQVDPSRGAGHAQGSRMRDDKAHLRTKFTANGMNYQGYNIAVHELGHNVEQVFTISCIDHTLLEGVPNTAFTEAFAFVFQGRDLEILSLTEKDNMAKYTNTLDVFWKTYEICGVGLLDMKIWRWLYENPNCNEIELKDAVISIAKEIWNKYYADVFGIRDVPILAIYSHIIEFGLYTPDYPLGHIIQFQLEKYFENANLAQEMERMCLQGRITPDEWMKGAVGKPISTQPLIDSTKEALKQKSL